MKMKNIVLLLICASLYMTASAQDEEVKKGGFKKENLFTGGNLTLQFGNQTTALGISPYFGYSLTNWLDFAASINFNYISQRDNSVPGDKIRQTVYGPGAFVRIFPVKFIFVQGHFEENFII